MPFEKGQSGNPGGQKKDKLFGDALRILAMVPYGEELSEDDIANETNVRRAARMLMEKAVDSDVPAIKEVADRLDGKVPQGVQGGDPDSPIKIAIQFVGTK